MAGYTLTRDGRYKEIALFDPSNGTHKAIASFDASDGRDRGLPAISVDALDRIAWLPDSRRIILLGMRGMEHLVLDVATGSIVPAGSTKSDGFVGNLFLSRDGRWIYGNSASLEYDIWMLDYGASR
jgi:hypothetical protein